jgi:hypothetical protein
VDVFLSERRYTEAAVIFFEQACAETEVCPQVVTTNKTACYPPALQRVLLEADRLTGKIVQQRIERNHGHLKRRVGSMRWLKTDQSAGLLCRAQGFIHNMQDGIYEWDHTPGDPRIPRAPPPRPGLGRTHPGVASGVAVHWRPRANTPSDISALVRSAQPNSTRSGQ